MAFYELEHGYYLYMCELEERGYICKNKGDIYKISRKEIKGVEYIKINRSEYIVIDAILRGEDTDGIKYAIATFRSLQSEDFDKSFDELYESLPDNAISTPLGRVRNRLGDKFGIDSELLLEIIPTYYQANMYCIPATRRDMLTMEEYKERHEPDAEQNHELVLGNNEPVQSFPENYSYSPAELSQINEDRLYYRLFSIFENDRKNHPSIRMMDPDPSLFPKGLPELLSNGRLAVEGEKAPQAIRDMILDSWKREDRRHILLVGEGGIGKTVAMLTLPVEDWFKELGVPVIYVPLQRLDIYEGDLNRYIKEKIGSNDYEHCIELANRTPKEQPNLLLLLDGFNEIPDRFKQTAEKSIREWMERPGIQIITTSRLGFFLEKRFLKYRLQPLTYDTVRSFLLSAGIAEEQLLGQNDRIWNVINVPLMLALYTQIEKVRKMTELSFAASVLEWREPDNAAHIIWDYLQMELYRCIEKDDSTYSVVQYAAAILAIAPYICCQMSRLNKFYIKRVEFLGLIRNALSFYNAHPDLLGSQILNIREEFAPYHEEELFLDGKAAGYAWILIDDMGLFQTQKIRNMGHEKKFAADYTCSLMHQNFRDALAAFFICSCLTRTYGAKEKRELLDQADHYVKDYMAEHLSDKELVSVWDRHRNEDPEDGPITFILMDLIGRQRNYDYRELDFSGIDLIKTNLHGLLSRRIDICPLPGDRSKLNNTKISVDCFLPKGHSSWVRCVAFSPDGQVLVSGGNYGELRVWNPESGESIKLEWHTDMVSSVTVSPDNRYLAGSAGDGTIRVWDSENGKLHVLEGHEDGVNSVAFSPDGRLLASGACDGTVRIWDLESGSSRVLEGHSSYVNSVVFSPDGRQLASGSHDNLVIIWNLESEKRRVLEGHTSWIRSVAFSPDGRQLASGADDGIIIWNLERNENLVLKRHNGGVRSVAFSPDGRHLASGTHDSTIHIWNLESDESHVLKGHTGPVFSVAFSPNGRQLASGSMDSSVRIWDLETGESRVLEGQRICALSVAFSPDGRLLASRTSDGTLRLWNLESGESRVLEDYSMIGSSIAFSPDGRHLASGADKRSVGIWDLESEESRVLEGHADWVNCVAYSPDGRHLASGADDGTVRIWELESGENRVLKGHESAVTCAVFNLDGSFLASGSNDSTIRIWNLESEGSRVLEGHTGRICSVAFSPEGRQLASCSWDGTARLWDLKSGVSRVLEGHASEIKGFGFKIDHEVNSVAFSPIGKRLACGAGDGTIRIWNLETGKRCVLKGHGDWVNCIAFSSDGRLLSSASSDGTVRLWDLEKYQEVGIFIIIHHLNLSGANFELAIIDEKDKELLRAAGIRI